jgi:hypothetical protein
MKLFSSTVDYEPFANPYPDQHITYGSDSDSKSIPTPPPSGYDGGMEENQRTMLETVLQNTR